jgi:hypothetical protein
MTHEVGMAAVAAELHLAINDLELDAADAVEKGAAALFLAGFGHSISATAAACTGVRPSVAIRAMVEGGAALPGGQGQSVGLLASIARRRTAKGSGRTTGVRGGLDASLQER